MAKHEEKSTLQKIFVDIHLKGKLMSKTVFNQNKVDFTKQNMFFGEEQNTRRNAECFALHRRTCFFL